MWGYQQRTEENKLLIWRKTYQESKSNNLPAKPEHGWDRLRHQYTMFEAEIDQYGEAQLWGVGKSRRLKRLQPQTPRNLFQKPNVCGRTAWASRRDCVERFSGINPRDLIPATVITRCIVIYGHLMVTRDLAGNRMTISSRSDSEYLDKHLFKVQSHLQISQHHAQDWVVGIVFISK